MPWVAKIDDTGPCNGDVIVRTEHGTLVAVVYAAATLEETMARANVLVSRCAYRDALKEIIYLRSAGDIDTAKNVRGLLKQVEQIALRALDAQVLA